MLCNIHIGILQQKLFAPESLLKESQTVLEGHGNWQAVLEAVPQDDAGAQEAGATEADHVTGDAETRALKPKNGDDGEHAEEADGGDDDVVAHADATEKPAGKGKAKSKGKGKGRGKAKGRGKKPAAKAKLAAKAAEAKLREEAQEDEEVV